MKFITHTKENTKSIRLGAPTLRIDGKSGSISFSKSAARTMNIKGLLLFHQNADQPEDWYIEVLLKDTENAFKFRESTGQYIMNNSDLARKILSSIGCEIKDSVSILVAAASTEIEGKTLWPLITKSAKRSR